MVSIFPWSSFSSCFCILVSFPQMLSGPLFSIHIYDIGTKMNHKLCLQRLLDKVNFILCAWQRSPSMRINRSFSEIAVSLEEKKKSNLLSGSIYLLVVFLEPIRIWILGKMGDFIYIFHCGILPDFSTWYPQVLSCFSVISLRTNLQSPGWAGETVYWFHGGGWEA